MIRRANNKVVVCPLCDTELITRDVFCFDGYRVITCSFCSTRFCQPFINNAEVYNDSLIDVKRVYLENTSLEYKEIGKLRPYLTYEDKNILDIGCATGSFLEKMMPANKVLGIEVSRSYENILKKKGIPYLVGNLDEILEKLPSNHYDLITMFDVFEHLHDLNKILSLINKKLSRDGIFINWTNNYDDCISDFAEITYRLSGGRLKYFMHQSFNRDGGHNYNFVKKSLDLLYKKHCFDVLEVIITDTPSIRLTKSIFFKVILELFYKMNSIKGKGKIICYVSKKR
ncbi:MAG: class I SAM-dependent methyltransferase [Nitrospirae bacterium]|nr:class I SAM-dependent methyltransferase [Nitrospirota bacterium]